MKEFILLLLLPAITSLGFIYFLFKRPQQPDYTPLPWTWKGKKRKTTKGKVVEVSA